MEHYSESVNRLECLRLALNLEPNNSDQALKIAEKFASFVNIKRKTKPRAQAR